MFSIILVSNRSTNLVLSGIQSLPGPFMDEEWEIGDLLEARRSGLETGTGASSGVDTQHSLKLLRKHLGSERRKSTCNGQEVAKQRQRWGSVQEPFRPSATWGSRGKS